MAGSASQMGFHCWREGGDVPDMECSQGVQATKAAAHQMPLVCKDPQVKRNPCQLVSVPGCNKWGGCFRKWIVNPFLCSVSIPVNVMVGFSMLQSGTITLILKIRNLKNIPLMSIRSTFIGVKALFVQGGWWHGKVQPTGHAAKRHWCYWWNVWPCIWSKFG